MIALALDFKIHEDEHGISAYGGNAIRIADHCSMLKLEQTCLFIINFLFQPTTAF